MFDVREYGTKQGVKLKDTFRLNCSILNESRTSIYMNRLTQEHKTRHIFLKTIVK